MGARKQATTHNVDLEKHLLELRKTKGGVTVTEADGETIVRTRDGDERRFPNEKAD